MSVNRSEICKYTVARMAKQKYNYRIGSNFLLSAKIIFEIGVKIAEIYSKKIYSEESFLQKFII